MIEIVIQFIEYTGDNYKKSSKDRCKRDELDTEPIDVVPDDEEDGMRVGEVGMQVVEDGPVGDLREALERAADSSDCLGELLRAASPLVGGGHRDERLRRAGHRRGRPGVRRGARALLLLLRVCVRVH